MAPFYAKCVECGIGPIELDTLRVHLRDVHKWTEEQIEAEQTKLREKGSVEQKMMSCDKCDRVFRLEHKLRAHRQKAHGGAPRLPGSYVVCSNCHKKCVDALELTAHWRKEHAGESMTSPPHRPVVKAPRASVDVKPSSSGSENATPIKRPRHNWVNDTRTHEEVLDEMEQQKLDRLRAGVMTERERRLNKVQKNENNNERELLLAQDKPQRDATVGDVLATAKRLIASKKDESSSEKRPLLYAIVGIESADRMKKFVDLTANNSFDNVMFFDASLVNKMCCDNDSDIKQEETSAMSSSSQMEVSGSGVFETVKKEKLDCPESTDSMNDDQEICILNILPSRDDLPTTSEEHSSSSETRAESRSRSRRSDDACADISSEIDWTSCLVCGVYQTSEEMRLSSLERSQNLMLFASLLAQNLMETDEAVRMYKETMNSQQFICHDHFIQAAAHIGKEAEDVCGEFPKNGLAEVPPSIKSDTLAYLRLYAVLLDGEAVLEADDATRFFCENLMRYYGKGGWQTRDASQNDLQTFEDASTCIDDQPETDSAIKTEALDANESSYFSDPKIEIDDTNGVSVMDLLCDVSREDCDSLDVPTTSVAKQEVVCARKMPTVFTLPDTEEKAIFFLQQRGVLPSQRKCKDGHQMKLIFGNRRTYWRCSKVSCGMQKTYLTNGTWFRNMNLTFVTAIRFLFSWSQDLTSLKWCKEHLSMSSKSCTMWNARVREAIAQQVRQRFSQKIGGQGMVVEVDETLFSKSESNGGRVYPAQWIVGGICRETKECFLKMVDNRSADVLLSIIKENVANGTTLYTDCWKGYSTAELDNAGFQHMKVNHRYNVVDTDSGAHMQTIERLWESLRWANKRRNGTRRNSLDSYLTEFIWRQQIGEQDSFNALLEAIRDFVNG